MTGNKKTRTKICETCKYFDEPMHCHLHGKHTDICIGMCVRYAPGKAPLAERGVEFKHWCGEYAERSGADHNLKIFKLCLEICRESESEFKKQADPLDPNSPKFLSLCANKVGAKICGDAIEEIMQKVSDD